MYSSSVPSRNMFGVSKFALREGVRVKIVNIDAPAVIVLREHNCLTVEYADEPRKYYPVSVEDVEKVL